MASAFKRFEYGLFGGGINNASPAVEIADDECVDISNFIFDQEDNLVVRTGTVSYNATDLPITANRITSLYDFQLPGAAQKLIATLAAKVYSINESTPADDITGTTVFPADTLWKWVTFNELAVGSHGGLTAKPVTWDGNASNPVVEIASAPYLRWVEVFNSRVFGVDAANPNRLVWSALGDVSDWAGATAGSRELTLDDGDEIVGLLSHRKALFIFTRKRVHVMTTGVPTTDPTLWRFDLYAEVGCVSGHTIKAILDDVFFLSDSGVLALSSTPSFGDFDTGTASQKVLELRDFARSIPNHYAVVDSQNSQYWLAIPSTTSGTENGQVFVCDFRRIKEGKLRWVRFTVGAVGSSFAQVNVLGHKRVFIGRLDGDILRYGDASLYNDNGAVYAKRVRTKAYSQNANLIRKEYRRWAASVELLTCPIAITVAYRFDERDYKSVSQSFNFSCTQTANGGFFGEDPQANDTNAALWDVALWDATSVGIDGQGFLFGGSIVSDQSSAIRDIQTAINKANGKRGQSIQFDFSNGSLDQAFKITNFAVDAVPIGIKKINDTP